MQSFEKCRSSNTCELTHWLAFWCRSALCFAFHLRLTHCPNSFWPTVLDYLSAKLFHHTWPISFLWECFGHFHKHWTSYEFQHWIHWFKSIITRQELLSFLGLVRIDQRSGLSLVWHCAGQWARKSFRPMCVESVQQVIFGH